MPALIGTILQYLYMQCICILSLIRPDCSAILSIWLHFAAPSGMNLNSFVSLVPLYPSKRRRLSSSSTQLEPYHTCIPYTNIHIFGWKHLSFTHKHTYILAHAWPTHIHKSSGAHIKPSGPHVWIHTYIYISFLEPMYIHKPPGAYIHTPYMHTYVHTFTHTYIRSLW